MDLHSSDTPYCNYNNVKDRRNNRAQGNDLSNLEVNGSRLCFVVSPKKMQMCKPCCLIAFAASSEETHLLATSCYAAAKAAATDSWWMHLLLAECPCAKKSSPVLSISVLIKLFKRARHKRLGSQTSGVCMCYRKVSVH